ncbi:MAG: hypothetical protein NT091_00010, partial [Candidatus Falkowbacteria bacterium]|nr:hypothetical protein [Candidatus Falkowbacteria bacterium]
EKVDRELKKIDRSGMLPAGAFLVGGGALIPGMIDVAKEKLRLPVCFGNNKTVEVVIEKVNEAHFLTALGLVIWGSTNTTAKKGFNMGASADVVKNFYNRVKNGIMSLKP